MSRRTALLLASIIAATSAAGPAAALAQDASLGERVAPVVTFDSAWSAIARTYWDTTLLKGRWRVAHDSLRALAVTATDDADARRLIRALIEVPRQSHFVLLPRSAATESAAGASDEGPRPGGAPTPGTAGLELRMIGDTLVAWRVARGGAAARAGIAPGAIIRSIDGVATDSLRALARTSTTDRVQANRLVNILATRMVGGSVGDTLCLRFDARDVRIVRTRLEGFATRFGNLPSLVVSTGGDSVTLRGRTGRPAALITFSAWFPAIVPELDGRLFAARGAPGVILDLRGNPGGIVGMLAGVSGHFLDTAVALGTMRARGATIRFVANPRIVDRTGRRVEVIGAPLAILVDGFTGSTSEFFASGMQALGRARVFGVSSAGQALPALMSALPNGDVLMHVIADHEDAGGRRVEGDGVRPDEVTPLTRADLLAGRDAALEAARAWLARTAGK
jgi:carboxyl-terminal processing protease